MYVQAMIHIMSKTCVKFRAVDETKDPDWVEIMTTNITGCYSPLG